MINKLQKKKNHVIFYLFYLNERKKFQQFLHQRKKSNNLETSNPNNIKHSLKQSTFSHM